MKPIVQSLIEKASTVIYDKSEEILLCLTCILSEGHLLIEDVPGVGKTTLVHTIAKLLDFQFSRIQFTNDLLPSDIIGNVIFDQEKKEFKFFEGPLFANLVLADELNRANPRTQSALLQAMEEFQVSQDKKTYNLPIPFILIATQNPKTQIGTFQLPESQLDRFLMSLELNFADKESELKIFQGKDSRKYIKELTPLLKSQDLILHQQECQKVYLSPLIAEYIYSLVHFTRNNSLYSPLSTQAGLALAKASKSYAYIQNREFVLPEDVQKIAPSVLGHRLGLSEGVKLGKKMVSEIISQTQIPV
jgi:MoxR-like ATPase